MKKMITLFLCFFSVSAFSKQGLVKKEAIQRQQQQQQNHESFVETTKRQLIIQCNFSQHFDNHGNLVTSKNSQRFNVSLVKKPNKFCIQSVYVSNDACFSREEGYERIFPDLVYTENKLVGQQSQQQQCAQDVNEEFHIESCTDTLKELVDINVFAELQKLSYNEVNLKKCRVSLVSIE